MMLSLLSALASVAAAAASDTTVTVSVGAGRSVTLEAVGLAFRVGVSLRDSDDSSAALATLMLAPGALPASNATLEHWPAAGALENGVGLRADFGAIYLANHTATQEPYLVLLDSANKEIIRSALLPPRPSPLSAPSCESSGTPGTDKAVAIRLKASTEDLKSDCWYTPTQPAVVVTFDPFCDRLAVMHWQRCVHGLRWLHRLVLQKRLS